MPTEMELTLEQTQQGVSYEVSILTSAGNPVKEILLKLNLPDHRKLKYGGEVKEFQRSFHHSDTERLSRSDEVLKLKNFKKDATLKLFKSTNQESTRACHGAQNPLERSSHNKNVDYVIAVGRALRDDLMFTTIRVISKHQDTRVYGAILPQHLTNQDMLKFEAYKTYRAYATGKKTLKPKSTKKKVDSESSPKTKPTQASKGKRIKTSAKGIIPAKKKQSATKSKGLTVLSEIALTEAEQMKISLERSKTQQHSSHASGSGADEGTGVTPGVPDDYDEEDDDNQDDDDQEHDDNDGDDFVHPKLSTHDEEDKEEEDSDPRVYTPSNYESTDDEESDEKYKV
ncbi:hypothetical protein Tco_0774823 [Tanacetum coccineum]|uniref:Uncharacterized protein n=1 Tax=Tanacetum coccineum TaxID=301880 RepID=A0ABQ4ZTB9_9ASTR